MQKHQPAAVTPGGTKSGPSSGAASGLTSAATFPIVLALTFAHFLNDMMQSLLPAIYPIIKSAYNLDFGQIGLITLTFQMVGSVLQPVIGHYTDKRPKPFSLVFGMGVTWCGLSLLALAPTYPAVLLAAGLVGLGSAVFHPESSRVARLASGGRHGFAQSLFQVGGNAGTALGPLLAAGIIVPRGQRHILWFGALALAGMIFLSKVGRWYADRLMETTRRGARSSGHAEAAGSAVRRLGKNPPVPFQ